MPEELMPRKKSIYKVTRTYPDTSTHHNGLRTLTDLLNEGYEIVCVNAVISDRGEQSNEYVLKK